MIKTLTVKTKTDNIKKLIELQEYAEKALKIRNI